MRRSRLAKLDEVRITRRGEEAVIEFIAPGTATTHLRIGLDLSRMSDQDIVDAYNHIVLAQERMKESFVATEIPEGRPQLEYSPSSGAWSPRGQVLRCVITDDEKGDKYIEIDGKKFTYAEFGRAIESYVGWGMRICFVSDDQLMLQPDIAIREPED